MARREENTKFRLIHPRLKEAGWLEFDWQIDMEYAITAGRIQWDGKNAKRSRPTYADYLLRYKPSLALAVIEAKDETKHHLEGTAQATEYAKKLGLWFAYATNGHEIEFFDLKAGTQQTVPSFHSPDELWGMYLNHAGIKPSPVSEAAITRDFYDESQIGQRRRPRYYQEKAVRAAIESILNGRKRVLIAQATGTGKTFVSMQLVYKLFHSRVAKKILFIVDRNLLADQAFNDFNNAMDKDACYRLSPKDDKFPLSRDLYFGIYQTLVGEDDEGQSTARPDRYREFPEDFFDLIVIDEAHRGGANTDGTWFRLLDYFKSAIQVGLTATPKRDETNNTYRYFGSPVIVYSLKDGIEDGYLSPYIIKRVTSNIDALGYRPEHQDVRDLRGRVLEVKDYLTPDFERQLSIPERTRAFALHLLKHLFSTDPLGKTIVFCVDQQHALDMAKYVSEAFLKYKERYKFDYNKVYAVRITGNDRDPNGKYPNLEKFSDIESNEPIVVTTSKLLTTGIDVRTIKNIVIFRNVGSMVEFKQIIGRGTRIYDHFDKHKEKLGFFILEYANFSTLLFNDPEWDDEPTAVIDDEPINVDPKVEEEPNEVSAELGRDENHDEEEDGSGDGVYEEPPEEQGQIRYRMSEDFLRGNVKMVAESVLFTGLDGKPLTPEKFILFQSEVLKKQFAGLRDLNVLWLDNKTRREFIEEKAGDLGLNLDALHQLFFTKYQKRDVDTLDVLSSLIFSNEYVTKDERIAKSRSIHKRFYYNLPTAAKPLIEDLIAVYRDNDFKPFLVSKELWQTTRLKKYGAIGDMQKLVGGSDVLMKLIGDFQVALYDERIAA